VLYAPVAGFLETVVKLLPILLLNVVVAGAAVLIYDQVRAADVPEARDVDLVGLDTSRLEARLAALEAREKPMLQATGADPRSSAKLSELERRLLALESARDSKPVAEDEDAPRATVPIAWAPGEEPSPEDVMRFRKLQKASHQVIRRKRNAQRVNGVVKKLGLSLSERQQEQLVDAYVAFEPRRNEIWTEAKSGAAAEGGAANWEQIIADTNERLQREFSEQISDFLPRTDAETLGTALGSK